MAPGLVSMGVISITPDGNNHTYHLKNGNAETINTDEFRRYWERKPVLFKIALHDDGNIRVNYWDSSERTTEEIIAELKGLIHSVIHSEGT
jgi:hypothetical protein